MINQLARYQQQLRRAIQRTENGFLQSQNFYDAKLMQENLKEQEILLKYLQIQYQRLSQQAKKIYAANIKRYRTKLRQHNQFFEHKMQTIIKTKQTKLHDKDFMNNYVVIEQNKRLLNDKMVINEGQRYNDQMEFQIQRQGKALQNARQTNLSIQQESDEAEGMIQLIQRAVDRRRLMFMSLVGLFIIALVSVLLIKMFKKR